MGIINTGQSSGISLNADSLVLTLTGATGESVSLELKDVAPTVGGGSDTNASESSIEPINVVSAGKGIRFADPLPSSPVVLKISKQPSFYRDADDYQVWQGSPIQVFQWQNEPNSDRAGAHWRGSFNPSNKQYILLNPTDAQPFFTFSTKNWDTGTWDTARVKVEGDRELHFLDFGDEVETWDYDDTQSGSSPSDSGGNNSQGGGDNSGGSSGGFDPTEPDQPATYATGWMPKDDWTLIMTENPITGSAVGAFTHYTPELAAIIDNDNSTSFTTQQNLAGADIRLKIDLGAQCRNISKAYIASGDFPHKSKGAIYISENGQTWNQVYVSQSEYLEGEISFSPTDGRWIEIHSQASLMVGVNEKWEIREVTVHCEYPV